VVEIISDTKRLPNVYRIPVQHLQGWATKAQNDLALWDSWTPEQRRSVDRQKGVWTLGLLASSVILLAVPHTGWVPMTLLSLAWWGRCHNWHWPRWAKEVNPKWVEGTSVPHWDVVRWFLGLPQLG
jgi:hypothetical protein